MGSIDQPLNGKILLITGGASGIGLSLTKQAHAIGAKILVADLKTTSDFDSFAAGKSNILYVQSDVTKWSDFDRMFAECEKKWGDAPDAYGICAGLFDPPFSNFWQDPEQEKGYMQVDVNVNHPVKLTRLAMRKSLQRGKRASVCIIASVGGIAGSPPAPLYCATKHAIVGFVKSLATTESLTGVKITSLCPAGVFTPLFDAAKIKQFTASADRYLTADTCAQHLLDLLQKKEYPCGTQLELTLNGTRVIPEWNVSAPQGDGTGQEAMDEEFLKNLMGPAQEACEKDRASAKL